MEEGRRTAIQACCQRLKDGRGRDGKSHEGDLLRAMRYGTLHGLT